MRGRTWRAALSALPVALLAASLASCGSGDPTYYRLAPWPGPAIAGGFAVGAQAIEIRTPTVASYLDRDYIVSKVDDYRLHLAGNDAWAEPIGDMIGRTLASDLSERLPGSQVFVEGSVVGASPRVKVDLDVSRFDKDGDGTTIVHAVVTLRDASGDVLRSEKIDLRDTPPGAGTAAFVASLSKLLGEIADRTASDLRALPPQTPILTVPPAG